MTAPLPHPADLPLRPPRVTLRWAEVVEGYISAQFYTEHGDGSCTHAGILSMRIDEWNAPAWRAVRQAVAACYENTSLPDARPVPREAPSSPRFQGLTYE